MPKTRKEKEQLVADYEEKLGQSKSIVFTTFSGLKTQALNELKNQLFEKGFSYGVAKNRLLQRVLKDQKIEIPSEILDKPLFLVFSSQDEISPAKIVFKFSKDNEALVILGGLIDKEFVDAEKVKTLALLPSREELLAKLLNVINSPRIRLQNVLTINQRKLLFLLKNIQKVNNVN